MRYFKHAWATTFEHFGGVGFFLSLVAIPLVGFALHYFVAGKSAMSAEFDIWLVYGLASAGLVFSVIFLWNLACAPYRIERIGRLTAESRLRTLGDGVETTKRLLTAEQKGLLTAAIRNSGIKPEHINVVHFSSEEPTDFADGIGDAIKQAGIECQVHDGGFYTKNPKDRGLKLYRGKSTTTKALADILNERLTDFGYPCEIRDADTQTNMYFYVARRSETNSIGADSLSALDHKSRAELPPR